MQLSSAVLLEDSNCKYIFCLICRRRLYKVTFMFCITTKLNSMHINASRTLYKGTFSLYKNVEKNVFLNLAPQLKVALDKSVC